MAETKWTNEQWEAIVDRDCNLLVAAAAGAGKTAVLVERIIKKITDDKKPIDIDKMLIVTFTNAAATEMRERIAEAISVKIEENPEATDIRRQLTLLGKASITTIHSFCLDVIRSNFQKINIDPAFRIADETECTLMKTEVLGEIFEEQYDINNEDFYELLESYGGNKNDDVIQDMVLSLYHFVQSSPWPEMWLDHNTSRLIISDNIDFSSTPWGRVLLDIVRIELEGIKEMLTLANETIKYAMGLEKYGAIYSEDLINVEGLITILDSENKSKWDVLYTKLQDIQFSRLPRSGKEVDIQKQEKVKQIRDDVKDRLKKLSQKIITSDSKEIIEDLKEVYPKIKCLSELVILFKEKYQEKKSKKSLVDFNDLEHYSLEILSDRDENGNIKPSDIAYAYKEKFDEILVDEYQDSNLIQETLVKMISKVDLGNPNVFMVGDVKQSIYRFRQAKPELFLEKYNTYPQERGNKFRKILLYKNFRSRKEVLHSVNYIFKQIMSSNVGELDYTDSEALNPAANYAENDDEKIITGGETELLLIDTATTDKEFISVNVEDEDKDNEEDTEQEEKEIIDNIQSEARVVAKRILSLIHKDENGRKFCVYDKETKKYRAVEYRDIVVLLRTTRNWTDVFIDEFSIMGIPAFADTGTGFFKTIEIQVVLSLLKVIDNPLQDIPLLSVLRSPIVGFTTNHLTDLRLVDKKVLLYDALVKLSQKDGLEISNKAEEFIKNLSKWREMSFYMSTDQLIWKLYNDTGYYAMVGAMPQGEQRQANLRILFERAKQFEETSYKGLFNFINFIDKLKSSQGDMGSAKILSENDNVVRLMSIHKSKGLEFPVVFLSGCGKKFNFRDVSKSILIHQDLGFGPEIVDHKLRLSWPSAIKKAIAEKIKIETLSEEMRILYVALTRAREKLIITGAVNGVNKKVTKWLGQASVNGAKLPDYEMLKALNYLDWICPAVIRHKRCDDLRNLMSLGEEFDGLLLEDPSTWKVTVWEKGDVLLGKISEMDKGNDIDSWKNDTEVSREISIYKDELNRRLTWEYIHKKVTSIPAKASVTELKRRFSEEMSSELSVGVSSLPTLVKKPMFLEEKKGLTASEIGTILHFVMQHLNFNNRDIKSQIVYMVSKELLTDQQAETVNVSKIETFLGSKIGKRLTQSNRVFREVPFNMEVKCSELYKEMSDKDCGNETILLQGVIDCYFEEPAGIVLLDYKTDYAPSEMLDIIKARYKLQMDYYARALELMTGKNVIEKNIYLFWSGETIGF